MKSQININKFFIDDNNYQNLCKAVFKMLNCNSLWIMNLNNDILNMVATDQSIWQHYLDKKYYLHEPTLNADWSDDRAIWKISLGTDSENFKRSGFLYDLYKIFDVEEFISIEKKTELEHYCFRFFTKNNRFIFMNKLLNDMDIIKYFINNMINKFQDTLQKQPIIHTLSLKEN